MTDRRSAATAAPGVDPAVPDRLTDAVLQASRAMVAIAARSLAQVDEDVTLLQFRALVVLSEDTRPTVGHLARGLGITPSSATRLCDRLVDRGLVRRSVASTNRREVELTLTRAGARLVERVTRARRRDLRKVLRHMPASDRDRLVPALSSFTDATAASLELTWPGSDTS